MAAFQQFLHQLDHLRDVTGGARLVGGGQAPERGVGVVQFPFEAVGVRPPLDTCLRGLGEDLVVDVGDVRDDCDVESLMRQPAAQHVEDHFLADVPEMR